MREVCPEESFHGDNRMNIGDRVDVYKRQAIDAAREGRGVFAVVA